MRFIVGEQFSYVFLLSAAALIYSGMPNCTPWVIIRTGAETPTLFFIQRTGLSLFPSLVYYPTLGFHFRPPFVIILPLHFDGKQQKLCVVFLLTKYQFHEVGYCRRHIFGPLFSKFYVEFENINSSCNPCSN